MSKQTKKDINQSTEENKETNRIYEIEKSLEKYPSVISTIPILGLILALVGALPQVGGLSLLGIGYVKYFSTSQLISDGLYILAPNILILALIMMHLYYHNTINESGTKGLLKIIGNIISTLLSIITVIIRIRMIRGLVFSASWKENSSWIGLIMSLTILLLIIIPIFRIFGRKKRIEYTYALSLMMPLIGIIVLAISGGAVYNDNQNLMRMESYLSNSGANIVRTKYMNDKYIFFEVTNNSGTFIEIRPFEELFTSNLPTNSGQIISTN